jgi:hypothetical protein
MWRQKADQQKRNLYRQIFDTIVAKGDDSPVLCLFWTWGRAFPVADGDIAGTGTRVKNGYHDLKTLLQAHHRHFIRITWRWGLQFAMWLIAPKGILEELRIALDEASEDLRSQLIVNGCHNRLGNPHIEVAIV